MDDNRLISNDTDMWNILYRFLEAAQERYISHRAGGVLIVVPGIPLQREFRVLKEDIPFYRIILECRELHSRTLQELQRERQMKEALEEVMGQYDE